jgi:hypothetical protein
MVVFQGKVMCLAEAAELAGIPAYLLRDRLNRGWSIERAVAEPRHG